MEIVRELLDAALRCAALSIEHTTNPDSQRSWCGLIAKRTFTLQHGPRAGASPPSTYTGLLNSLATSAYAGIMVATSLALSLVLARVPVVGPFAGFTFFCWVDA